jgi:ATP-dependent DNA helicase 2 subunit 2
MSDNAVACAIDVASTLLHSKMVDKVEHEVGVIAFGTATTRNDLADECTARSGNADQYQNITTAIPIGLPMSPSLKALHSLSRRPEDNDQSSTNKNHVSCDFVDALTVALDHIAKEIAPGAAEVVQRFHRRRLILLSSFRSPVKPDPNGEFIDTLIQSWVSRSIEFEVLCVDEDFSTDKVKESNLAFVHRMLQGLVLAGATPPPILKRIKNPILLAGSFPVKEYSPTHTLSSVALSIGDTLKIPVKLATKTTREKFPTLGKESPLTPPSDGAGGGIEISREWFREDDERKEHPIPDAERVVGYRYGKDVVPMSAEDLELATFRPNGPQGLTVVGCVDAATIPRHALMSHALVMVANKDVGPAKTALSSIIRRLHARDQVLIIRRVRPRGTLQFLVAHPVLGLVEAPSKEWLNFKACSDHFVCNVLPFREDVRAFSFSSFDRDDRRPTEEQYQAALDLIDEMTSGHDDEGGLSDPTSLPNPALHRFINHMVSKALDESFKERDDPERDALLRVVLRPRSAESSRVREAAQRLVRSLPGLEDSSSKSVRLLHPAVHKVREECAEEDFKAMMAQENYADALTGATRVVTALVRIAESRAVSLLLTMRMECKTRRHQVNAFNTHLTSIFEFLNDTEPGFLRAAAQAGATPISVEEMSVGGDTSYRGDGVQPHVAEEFRKKYIL